MRVRTTLHGGEVVSVSGLFRFFYLVSEFHDRFAVFIEMNGLEFVAHEWVGEWIVDTTRHTTAFLTIFGAVCGGQADVDKIHDFKRADEFVAVFSFELLCICP